MKFKLSAILILSVLLSACYNDDEDDNNEVIIPPGEVAVATVQYGSGGGGSHASISTTGEYSASKNLLFTENSDITLAAGGTYFYRIGRSFGGNNVSKISFDSPQNVIWQYSVKDDPQEAVAANPSDMIVVNDQKAYVLRYGKDKVWIVNPSATTEEEFKIGELDLSAYNDSDGKPEMNKGVIVDGKLFIVMQRLVDYAATEISYVAVFDVATDTEIDTNYPGDAFKGIPLVIKNPQSDFVYSADDNSIYISAIGAYSATDNIGGIEKINVVTYDTALVFDDGEIDTAAYGKVTAMAVVSPTKMYFIGCANCTFTDTPSFTDYSVYKFDSTNMNISAVAVTGLENSKLANLALSPKNELWISAGDATLYVLDTSDDTLITTLDTFMDPKQVVFKQ